MIVDPNGAAIHVTEGGVAGQALVFLHYWGGAGQAHPRRMPVNPDRPVFTEQGNV